MQKNQVYLQSGYKEKICSFMSICYNLVDNFSGIYLYIMLNLLCLDLIIT